MKARKWRTTLFLGVLIPGLWLMPEGVALSQEHHIYVVLRYDDYSNISPTALEVKLLEAFKRFNIKCTFGVIPFIATNGEKMAEERHFIPIALEKRNLLRPAIEEGILEVAVHGYSHESLSRTDTGLPSEFWGLNFDSQLMRVREGKTFLEELLPDQVVTFVPPVNTYDRHTLRALEEAGYSVISADIFGPVEKASNLKFIPETVGLLDLKKAILSARKISRYPSVVVVLFHATDFLEINPKTGKLNFDQFVQLLSWIKDQQDVRVRSFAEVVSEVAGLDSHHFIQYRSFIQMYGLIPPILRPAWRGIYFSENTIGQLKKKGWIIISILYGGLFAAAIKLAMRLTIPFVRRPKYLTVTLKYVYPVIFLVLGFCLLWDRELGYLRSLAGTSFLGAFLGTCFSLARSTNARGGRTQICGEVTS